MDGDSWLSWFLLLILLAAAAYFALAESAMTNVSRIRLRMRLDRGEAKAERALFLQDNFNKAISTILIGTNIVHITAATLTTVMVTRTWGSRYVALGTAACTLAVFFAGEMLPKNFGKRYSERASMATARSLCFFMRLFAPLASLLESASRLFARLFPSEGEVSVTADELHDIIENMTDEGELDTERGELVQSALEFGEVTAEQVLTPRVDLTALDVDDPPEVIFDAVRSSRHSRLPVFEGSIDNIIGILQIRRYIRSYLKSGVHPELRPLLDEPCFVHLSASVDELLEELSRRKLNLAVVTDNYGGTAGIVTVEDILEELVGEIYDEEDVAEEEIRSLSPGCWEVSADTEVEELLDTLDVTDPEDTEWEHKPLSEWVYEHFDLIPAEGDSFEWNGLRVTVTGLLGRRIRTVRVEKIVPAPTEGGADS